VGPGLSVELQLRVDDYLKLETALILAFGLCFQLPVILALLGMAGIISSQMLVSGRRYAIVGVTAVAAVITPPDPVSMISLIIPIVMLYEVSIWVVRLIELRKVKEEAADQA
jgi:sec-independent protein translocase protein TatC